MIAKAWAVKNNIWILIYIEHTILINHHKSALNEP